MAAITLSDLNNYMKNLPSGAIVPEEMEWKQVPLFNALKGMIDREAFKGSYIEVLVKTAVGGAAQAFAENVAIPSGYAPAYVKQLIGLKEIIANAELTLQIKNQAIGGDASWGVAVDEALKDMFLKFYKLNERAALGAGKGYVARVASASYAGTTLTITCDNKYNTDGIENTEQLVVGDRVDIYRGSSAVTNCTGLPVTAVTPGYRTAAGSYAFVNGTVAVTIAADPTLADNDEIYLVNTYTNGLPAGLLYFIQGATTDDYAGTQAITTFQNLTRSSYPCLQATIYQATDFGPTSESPSDGVPCSWDLSVVTDAIVAAERNSGEPITDLFVHDYIAMAMNSLNKSDNNMSVQVSTTGATHQVAVGGQYAKTFEKPDGSTCQVHVCSTLPRHVMHGIPRSSMRWHPQTEFDFLRLYGDIWGPTKGDSYANFEAPYYGAYNLSARRCDGMFSLQDLRWDV